MITHEETAAILAKLAACDQRTVGRADLAVWHEILNLAKPPITCDDALAGIAEWHAEQTDGRMRPAHVIQTAHRVAYHRAGRERAQRMAERIAIEALPAIQAAGDDELLTELRSRMGTGDLDVLRRPEWVEHRRNLERQSRAAREPNRAFAGWPPPGGWPVPGVEQ